MVRSRERIKKYGEVFTPPELIQEMLDKIPDGAVENPTKTVIDPACGDGNFLVEVLRMRLAANQPVTQSLATIFGVEIQCDNVEECRQRLLDIAGDTPLHRRIVSKNIVCANTFEYDMSFL